MPAALLEELSPSSRGVVCAGMPRDLSGVYAGRERMLAEGWSQVFAAVEIRPIPEEYLPARTDRIVVTGRYVGSADRAGALCRVRARPALRRGARLRDRPAHRHRTPARGAAPMAAAVRAL